MNKKTIAIIGLTVGVVGVAAYISYFKFFRASKSDFERVKAACKDCFLKSKLESDSDVLLKSIHRLTKTEVNDMISLMEKKSISDPERKTLTYLFEKWTKSKS